MGYKKTAVFLMILILFCLCLSNLFSQSVNTDGQEPSEDSEEITVPVNEIDTELPVTAQSGNPQTVITQQPVNTPYTPVMPPATVTQSPAPTRQPEITVPPDASPAQRRRINTLRFGTDTEIANLVQTLRSENDTSLDDIIIEVALNTNNKNILMRTLEFFGEREKTGLERKAIEILEGRDYETNDVILAAIDYLGRVNAANAISTIEDMIITGEARFLNNSIRALGRAARGSDEADRTADFLLDYYMNRDPNSENQREIVVALGETGSTHSVHFLSDLARNPETRTVLRMAALDSLGKIGDPEGLDSIIEAVTTADPNVRSSAIAALGPFSGEASDRAILEGFRDSYYRSRIGAAQAAGRRKLEAAVPFLSFRAENDEVPAVRDASIRALGAIWNAEAIEMLETLFFERNNSDRVRILAGEMLITYDSARYALRTVAELEDSRARHQNALYNGILRILGPAVSPELEALARRFLVSGNAVEKAFAMDMAANNNFTSLEEEIRSNLDERRSNASLSRRAHSTLERMGLTSE